MEPTRKCGWLSTDDQGSSQIETQCLHGDRSTDLKTMLLDDCRYRFCGSNMSTSPVPPESVWRLGEWRASNQWNRLVNL